MKKIMLFTLLMGIITSPLWAQQTESPVTLYEDIDNIANNNEITRYFSKDLFIYANQLATDANSVAIINTVGNSNETTIIQSGRNNVGVIKTRGDDNYTKLIQDGTNLLSFIGVEGKSNRLFVDQNGEDLVNKVLLRGTGLKYKINQNESGALIKLLNSSTPLLISHSGGPLAIKISNN